jgi:hypothetical protein
VMLVLTGPCRAARYKIRYKTGSLCANMRSDVSLNLERLRCKMASCTEWASLQLEWVVGGNRVTAPYCQRHAQQIAWDSAGKGNLLRITKLRGVGRSR